MSEKITLEEVREVAERLVAERGEDYTYQYPKHNVFDRDTGHVEERTASTCVYADFNGTPSCIVGAISAEIAPEFFDHLREGEWDDEGSIIASALIGDFPKAATVFEEDALDFLHIAQQRQDRGETWRIAVNGYPEEDDSE